MLVGCATHDYSASRIARAVEDCDAHLLNLNVTSMGYTDGDDIDYAGDDAKFPVMFDLRVSHRNAESIPRSLSRYGYTVISVKGEPDTDDVRLKERMDYLMRYLEK